MLKDLQRNDAALFFYAYIIGEICLQSAGLFYQATMFYPYAHRFETFLPRTRLGELRARCGSEAGSSLRVPVLPLQSYC